MTGHRIHAAELVLAALVVALAVPAHVTGLLVPTIYRDPAVLLPQNHGTDVVTLGVAALLALSTAAVARGSRRARLLWLGALGYMVYAYGMYALGVRWNQLFLLYAALFGLSFYALVLGLTRTDAVSVRDGLAGRLPVRWIAGYLIVIAVIVAGLWLAEEGKALASGRVPPTVLQFETPTNIVHVFDLSIALPALLLAGIQLLRDRPWGYVLAGMLLIKATTIGLWIVAMIWFSARSGYATPPAYTAFFAALSLMGALLTATLLRRAPAGVIRPGSSG